jgi:hypothetical protein
MDTCKVEWALNKDGVLQCSVDSIIQTIDDEPDKNDVYDNTYKLKVSEDKQYAVVYNIARYYADFYKYNEYGEIEYLYTKKRNDKFLIEFFKSPTNDNITLVMFYSSPGKLTLFYADTGMDMYYYTDKEDMKNITDIKMINDKYMYMSCWYWQPEYCTYLYDIKSFLTEPDYQGVLIDCDSCEPNKESHFKLNSDNMIEVFSKTDKWHQLYSLDDFYSNHGDYKILVGSIKKTNKIIKNTNNILHRIQNGLDSNNVSYNDDALQKFTSILNDDDKMLIECSCFGNTSQQELPYHVYSIMKDIDYNDETLNYIMPKTLFNGHTTNLHNICAINLTFTLKKGDIILKMTVTQTMKEIGENNYEVDPNLPCIVTFV